jgi:hypothetical protein
MYVGRVRMSEYLGRMTILVGGAFLLFGSLLGPQSRADVECMAFRETAESSGAPSWSDDLFRHLAFVGHSRAATCITQVQGCDFLFGLQTKHCRDRINIQGGNGQNPVFYAPANYNCTSSWSGTIALVSCTPIVSVSTCKWVRAHGYAAPSDTTAVEVTDECDGISSLCSTWTHNPCMSNGASGNGGWPWKCEVEIITGAPSVWSGSCE